jgi:hypothetical protein
MPDPVPVVPVVPVPVPEVLQPVKNYKEFKLQRADNATVYSPGTVRLKFVGGENVERLALLGTSGSSEIYNHTVFAPYSELSVPVPAGITSLQISGISWFTDNKGGSSDSITVSTVKTQPSPVEVQSPVVIPDPVPVVPVPEVLQPVKNYKEFKLQRADNATVYSPGTVRLKFVGGENVERLALLGTSGSSEIYNHTVFAPFSELSVPVPSGITSFQISGISWFTDNKGGSSDSITVSTVKTQPAPVDDQTPVIVPDPVVLPVVPTKTYSPFIIQKADNLPIYSPGSINIKFAGGENVAGIILNVSGFLYYVELDPPFNQREIAIPEGVTDFEIKATSYFSDNKGTALRSTVFYANPKPVQQTVINEQPTPVDPGTVNNTGGILPGTPKNYFPMVPVCLTNPPMSGAPVEIAFKDGFNVDMVTIVQKNDEVTVPTNLTVYAPFANRSLNIPAGTKNLQLIVSSYFTDNQGKDNITLNIPLNGDATVEIGTPGGGGGSYEINTPGGSSEPSKPIYTNQ